MIWWLLAVLATALRHHAGRAVARRHYVSRHAAAQLRAELDARWEASIHAWAERNRAREVWA